MTLKSQTCKLFLACFMLALSSCSDTINNLSMELFAIKGFSTSHFSKDGLAITPTATGLGSSDDARTIASFLDRAVLQKFSGPGLITSSQVSARMTNDPFLKKLWDQMEPHISAHSVRGMEPSQSFARQLKVRYLLETEVQMAEIAGGAEQVRIYGRVYDTVNDRIVWEGIGEGRGYLVLIFPSTPASFRVIAHTAVDGLVSHLYHH